MKEFDPKSLTETQRTAILAACQDRITKSILNDELKYVTESIDAAINQRVDIRQFYNLTATAQQNNSLTRVEAETENNDVDEFSMLKVPLLYKLHRALTSMIKNTSFPVDGDWIKIDRKNDKTLEALGLRDFIPLANEEWERILKVENDKFDFKRKYSSNIAEFVAYGMTGGVHFYNDQEHYIDIKAPGIRNVGVWPLTDRWREATLILKYDMPFLNFKNREDFDEEYRSIIRPDPGTAKAESRDARFSIKDGMTFAKDLDVPADHIRLYDLYFPCLYVDDDLALEKLFITVAMNPTVKTTENLGSSNFIMKASIDVSDTEHGINIGQYSTTLPGQFYSQGPLIPFIPDQLQLNQIKAGISRIVAYICDPPVSRVPNGSNYDQTPAPGFEPGAEYDGWDVKTLIPDSYYTTLPTFQNYYGYLNTEVEGAVGLNPNAMGSPLRGKRTAEEVEQFNQGTAIAVNDASLNFDDFLKGSVVNRHCLTIQYLVDQVEGAVESLIVPEEVMSLEDKYNTVLVENLLFQRMKTYSGIEFDYKDFYERKQEELMQEEQLLNQIQQAAQSIAEIEQALQQPIPPFKGSSSPIAIGYQPVDQEEGYNQTMAAQRAQMGMQAQALGEQVKVLKLQLTGVRPVPEASDFLFYEILSAQANQSDLTVSGSLSGVQKQTALRNLAMIIETAQSLPQFAADLDVDKISDLLTRSNNMSPINVKKSQAQKMRDQAQLQAQQQQQQMTQNNEQQSQPS